jgi:hypothetical protein
MHSADPSIPFAVAATQKLIIHDRQIKYNLRLKRYVPPGLKSATVFDPFIAFCGLTLSGDLEGPGEISPNWCDDQIPHLASKAEADGIARAFRRRQRLNASMLALGLTLAKSRQDLSKIRIMQWIISNMIHITSTSIASKTEAGSRILAGAVTRPDKAG